MLKLCTVEEAAECWGLLWHSKNRLDGRREYLIYKNGLPLLFTTRKEAQARAEQEWGYIKTRPDLRGEPHGWRMPKPVRVMVTIQDGRLN